MEKSLTINAFSKLETIWKLTSQYTEPSMHMKALTSYQFAEESYLLAGVDDGEAGEEALSNGLLHDLESCADESLASNDGSKSGQNPERVECSIWQRRPEACGVVLGVLCQVSCLQEQQPRT